MRQKQNIQLPLAVPASNHPRAQLLEKISRIVDENPTFNELIWQDLTAGKMDHGNHGLTAEQVLRCAILKQLEQLSYDDLMFLLNETPLYQSFCRIGIGGRIPSRSSVAEGIKAVSSETWEKINVILVRYAASEGVEKGREVRGDCTVVESNIPKPFDSVLLYDSVRVITRILKQMLSPVNLATDSVFIWPADSGVKWPPIPLQSCHSVSSVFSVPALPNFNINSPLLLQSSPHFFFSWTRPSDQSCRSCG